MIAFFAEHLATILISLGLIAIVTLIITAMIKNKRSGHSSCGCGSGCAGCAMKGCCHKTK